MISDKDVCSQKQKNVSSSSELPETHQCETWDYSMDIYESTIVTEWDLVCDRVALTKYATGVYITACSVGTVVCGWLADRYVICSFPGLGQSHCVVWWTRCSDVVKYIFLLTNSQNVQLNPFDTRML